MTTPFVFEPPEEFMAQLGKLVTSLPIDSNLLEQAIQSVPDVPAVPAVTPSTLETNICSDVNCENDLIAAMSQLSSEPDPPAAPVMPSLADAYIGHLKDGWASAADRDDVIMITPQNLSRAQGSLMLGNGPTYDANRAAHYQAHLRAHAQAQHSQRHFNEASGYSSIRTPSGYDEVSDEEANLLDDLTEKADAIYDKVCSVEQTDAYLVEGFTHVNDYLDMLSKDIMKLKIDMERRDIELRAAFNNMRNQIQVSNANNALLSEKLDRVLQLLSPSEVAQESFARTPTQAIEYNED